MKIIQPLPSNARGRDLYVGGIHGCMDMLHTLLKHVSFDSHVDRLLCVGGLVDHGPDSLGASALVDEVWFHSVRSVHEQLTLWALGADAIIESNVVTHLQDLHQWHAGLSSSQRDQVIRRFASLPLHLKVEQADGRVFWVSSADGNSQPGWSDLLKINPADLSLSMRWTRPSGTQLGSVKYSQDAVGLAQTYPQRRERPVLEPGERERIRRMTFPIAHGDLWISGHKLTYDFKPIVIFNRLMIETFGFVSLGCLTLVEPRSGLYWQARRARRLSHAIDPVIDGLLPPPCTLDELLDGPRPDPAASSTLGGLIECNR